MRAKRQVVLWVTIFTLGPTAGTLVAQPYRGKQPGGQPPRPERNGDRELTVGTERGLIEWIRAYGDKGAAKTGTIALHLPSGRQFMAQLTPNTTVSLGGGAGLAPEKARTLLGKGVPVILNWRRSEDVSGRLVTDIQIQTVEINGTIKSVTKKRVTVEALPTEKPVDPPPIRAGGKRPPPPARETPPTKKKFKTLSLAVSDDVSSITVNGTKAEVTEVKPAMKFDAVVMDGGPRLILELNVRDKDGSAERNEDKGRKSGPSAAPGLSR